MNKQAATGATFGTLSAPRTFRNLTGQLKNIKDEIRTPGWQMLWKVVVFLILIITFGVVYQITIGNNPEEWAHPTDDENNSIVNGFYVSTVINSTVGYGDYYPYSSRAILLVIINVIISWLVFTFFLG